MSEELDRIKDRIRKCLNTARDDAATEGEIDNAMRMAQKMMARHHFSEEDLVEAPEDQYEKVRKSEKAKIYTSIGKKAYLWERNLAVFCRDFVGGIGCFRDPNPSIARSFRGIVMSDEWTQEPYHGQRFCFYGVAEDARMAAELFHELRLTIVSLARLKFGSAFKGDGGTYSEGFVSGMFTKMREENRQEKLTAPSTSHGLIVLERRKDLIDFKTKESQRFLAANGIKLTNGGGTTGSSGSHAAFHEGRQDGQKTEVSKKARTTKIEG